MWRLERILCPVDLSDASRRAFDYALALGREHEAGIRVVQVVDMTGWIGGTQLKGATDVADSTRASAREALDWWVARSVRSGTAVVADLVDGPVVSGIIAAADDLPADLIVMGSHGRSGFERLTIGSVTEKVLRKSHRPVLVVPSREDAIVRTGRLGRIVCATDFSEHSLRAVSFATSFAEAGPSPLSLMTVIDWPFGDSTGPDPVTQLRQSLEQEATASLTKLIGEEQEGQIDVAVRRGKPGHEIVRYARDVLADLIIVGVSGRGALDRALLGSTAEQVLRDAPCPVLTVPEAPES